MQFGDCVKKETIGHFLVDVGWSLVVRDCRETNSDNSKWVREFYQEFQMHPATELVGRELSAVRVVASRGDSDWTSFASIC